MHPRNEHRYVAQIEIEGHDALTTAALVPDAALIGEWARWGRARKNPARLADVATRALITPAWDRKLGAPFVAELEVAFDDEPARAIASIPNKFFANLVQNEVSALVRSGAIEEGAKYTWRLLAYPSADVRATPVRADPFAVEEALRVLPAISDARIGDLVDRAIRHGPERAAERRNDHVVFFAPHVLREASELAVAAGEIEAGGVLLGRFLHDANAQDLALEVSALVPARAVVADADSLRFTRETWQAVDAARKLRRGGEQIVGWAHSHPAKHWPCRNCPQTRRSRCPSNMAFFSAMDVNVHRTAFFGAHNVALLLSFHAEPAPRIDLFGWRKGMIALRDYYVLEEQP